MSSYIVKCGEYFGERNEEEFEYQDGDNLDKLDAESAAIESYYTAIQDYGWDWCYIPSNLLFRHQSFSKDIFFYPYLMLLYFLHIFNL